RPFRRADTRDVREVAETRDGIYGPNAIAVGSQSLHGRIAVCRTNRSCHLSKCRAADTLTSLDAVSRYTDIVGRCSPAEEHVATRIRVGRQSRGCAWRLSVYRCSHCRGASEKRVPAEIGGGIGGADAIAI